ncbi:hypothetical protein PoB_003027600 [Plakobranchus ocellatus]|uniref:Uncharacterized protein n=1 Tax=Plakobranchus ocellatus TaxID=259542 RepID=A0AAV4A677_9GAST|nr:hypothetical protein PoB_003027600 [Plakobranchus ocellatus]
MQKSLRWHPNPNVLQSVESAVSAAVCSDGDPHVGSDVRRCFTYRQSQRNNRPHEEDREWIEYCIIIIEEFRTGCTRRQCHRGASIVFRRGEIRVNCLSFSLQSLESSLGGFGDGWMPLEQTQ